MKKTNNIHNLDTLQREIYRLKLEARNMEEKLNQNMDYLQKNCGSMTLNSFFHKSRQNENSKRSVYDSFIKSDICKTVVSKIKDRVAGRAADSIDSMIDKLFNSKK